VTAGAAAATVAADAAGSIEEHVLGATDTNSATVHCVVEVELLLLLLQSCYGHYHSPKYSHLNATPAVLHACFSVSATCSDVPQYSTAHLSLSSVITCCSICTCLSINMLDKRIAGVSVLCVQIAVALKTRRSICCSKYCYRSIA
jgi:hypothetical protein